MKEQKREILNVPAFARKPETRMKGIILAGGMGTRLDPLTRVTNKHLLPVYNKPMIFYPILSLAEAGITEIMIVVGGNSIGDFLELLGDGKDFGVKLTYRYQQTAGGIAHALGLAQSFAGNENVCVVLGDNILEDSIAPHAKMFSASSICQAMILLKEVDDPRRFGVATLNGDTVVKVEEKPKRPESNLAVIGVYFYTPEVFQVVKTLKPSWRNELEITDVQNYYIQKGTLLAQRVRGFWSDAGTFESLLRANQLVAEAEDKKAGQEKKPAKGKKKKP